MNDTQPSSARKSKRRRGRPWELKLAIEGTLQLPDQVPRWEVELLLQHLPLPMTGATEAGVGTGER